MLIEGIKHLTDCGSCLQTKEVACCVFNMSYDLNEGGFLHVLYLAEGALYLHEMGFMDHHSL